MDRREFFARTAVAAAGLVSGCRRDADEAERRAAVPPTGPVREYRLRVAPTELDLGGGPRFSVFGYNGSVPGPEIRVIEGDTVRVVVHNQLDEGTTIHWHGLPVPNRMDGVPDVTQEPIAPGRSFTYEFVAQPAGTYVYHSHVGYQLDQGLHGAIVIESRQSAGHDREFVLALEDWATVDGGGPSASRAGRVDTGMMRGGSMMGGRGMMGGRMGGMMRRGRVQDGDPLQQPRYDAYAING